MKVLVVTDTGAVDIGPSVYKWEGSIGPSYMEVVEFLFEKKFIDCSVEDYGDYGDCLDEMYVWHITEVQ